ncbi:hypothetical protein [Haloarcula marismortui]|jgi:hypothetical protein|uniref:hypothetical protein n=1 Tax=Haloarcula marismortui TaxID=2238 RepID=UPI0009B5C67A|nr:hypothetical protein [Haloarcula californiae]
MVDRNTTLGDHSEISRKLLHDVESFIDEIGTRSCTAHLQAVMRDGKFLKGKQLGQKPERFVEDALIVPVLETLGHSVLARPVQYAPRWTHGRGIPDFSLTTIPTATAKEHDIRLFVEAKPPNKLHYARDEVKEYLKKDLGFGAIAVLTDGIQWELWVRPQNEPLTDDYKPERTASLRPAITDAKTRNLEKESYHPHHTRNKIDADEFNEFTVPAVCSLVQEKFGIAADIEES